MDTKVPDCSPFSIIKGVFYELYRKKYNRRGVLLRWFLRLGEGSAGERSGKPLNRSNIWGQMKKLCWDAGVKASKAFPHNLRKLFARTFYGPEKDIAKLADILGHSSIDTTRIYIISTGTEHRRKMERLRLVI